MRHKLLLVLALLCVFAGTTQATDLITDVMLVGGSGSEVNALKNTLLSQGWIDSGQDLNKNASGDFVYLLYKKRSTDGGVDFEFITDFYLWRKDSNAPATRTYNGRTYNLVPYDGGKHFRDVKGDLNSNAGGSDIHLYYTKQAFDDNRGVTGITFNSTKSGALGAEGGSEGYDLNKNAGGDYIYMHFTTAVVNTTVTPVIINPDPENPTVDIPVNYDLWIGNTQVTSHNKDNILNQVNGNGNATARYDATTKTLTLSNPTIEGTKENAKIYADGIDLTISGGYTLIDNDADDISGIKVNSGSLTISGSYTFELPSSSQPPLAATGNITFLSGTLTTAGGNVGMTCGLLNVGGAVTKLEAQGSQCAIQCSNINIDDNLGVSEPADGQIAAATHVKILPCTELPEVAYNLWVGNRQVTSHNKGNILNQTDGKGEPTAQYNAATQTLTLSNPSIEEYHQAGEKYYKIYATGINLTLKGSYSYTATEWGSYDNCGLGVDDGSLTVEGDYTFDMPECDFAIKAGTVILRSGSLKAVGYEYGIRCSSLTMESGFTRLEAKSDNVAMNSDCKVTLAENLLITTPSGSWYEYNSICDPDTYGMPSHVVIINGGTMYNLWLGNTRVMTANKDNILGEVDGNNKPTATFNPETNVLTLNSPNISGINEDEYCKIYSSGINLTLKGSYSCIDSSSEISRGILTKNGTLTIAGDFTFNVSEASAAVEAGELTLQSGSLTAVGNFNGIDCSHLTIASGFSRLEAQSEEFAIDSENGYDISDNMLIEVPEEGRADYSWIVDKDGNEAKHVVIATTTTGSDPGTPYDLWLGSVRVTSANQDNILNKTGANGNPTAQYDPDTQTLTLNNPTISGAHNYSKIHASSINLTIAGSYSCSESNSMHNLKQVLLVENGSLTIAGDISLSVSLDADAIIAEGVTLRSGSLTANGYDYGIKCKTLTIESGFTRLEAQSRDFAIDAQHGISIADNQLIDEPVGGAVEGPFVLEHNTHHASHVVIVNANTSAVKFPLWLGNTRVTSDNMGNILGQTNNGKPTAVYNRETNVLTLNNPNISGSYENAKICSYINGLDLRGTYHMTEAEGSDVDYGFLEDATVLSNNTCLYDTEIDGDFTFYGGKTGVLTNGYAEIHIKEGTLKAVGTAEYGLKSEWFVDMDEANAHLELQGGQQAYKNTYDYPIYFGIKEVRMVAPEHGIIQNNQYYEADGTTIARHLVLDVADKIYLTLTNNKDNSNLISDAEAYGKPLDVTLAGRTLYKDGTWNTICLPFSLTLSGSVLNGAEARTLSSASLEDGTLTLNFGNPVEELLPGVPYIIKWIPVEGYVDNDEYNLVNPMFGYAVISSDEPDTFTSTDGYVSFCGTYSYRRFDAEDKSTLLVGASNTLYYPQSSASIGACRAYFHVDGSSPVKEFKMKFDSDSEDGIINVNVNGNGNSIYNLAGQKLSKPQKGVNVINGRKVLF